ncbi:hypothetical protein QJS10_CPA05g00220 [Acorus calamus]|uniref:ARM repeat superfamily protein n=1 Tax=Acorus calamus TaxID=4465 RepID=A0AAV9EQZ1_ACOCL|nr:hypothetical protein QJS10_CPA05g00220 [Acorus calamus]
MGFISRKVIPACGNMCVCCPVLRPSSQHPVKRYKKYLAEIFPKTLEGPPNDRKIIKLCEYAAKNPFRIPKIAKYLEQRCYKELRSGHLESIKIIHEAYSKLLCMCMAQMAYFAESLLNVVIELLGDKRHDDIRTLGCQTLTRFIYSQADRTYTHNIENLAPKVCALAYKDGEDLTKSSLRAAGLHCLSAMVWFMARFSHIFAYFDEIVKAILDNYGVLDDVDDDTERVDSHHHWVDEIVRCETRSLVGVGDGVSPMHLAVRPRPEIKDISTMTREEIESPRVWAQICIQKIAELAKESTTMRRLLEPMFLYFDEGRHWAFKEGLAMVVLSDMSYLVEGSGIEQSILGCVIRHLDHKNVVLDPQVKSDIVQIATALVRQLNTQAAVDVGIIRDLCRHLTKSLQATVDVVGHQESNWNIMLQNSIESCLLEISRQIGDARPLLDMMMITLEKLPSVVVVARATIESLLILAHTISFTFASSNTQQVFPEALLLQLLKAMVHPDVETRIGAHRIFSVLLVPCANNARHGAPFQLEYLNETRRWQSKTASVFASASALLAKLRREKEGLKTDKPMDDTWDEFKDSEVIDEELKHGWARKTSPNLYLNCLVIDRTACSTTSMDTETNIVILSEDQIAQLLSSFWVQANLPDNLPGNFQAIAHSFSLTLISSRMKNPVDSILMRSFQLPLSLKNVALDSEGKLPPSVQRSLFAMATAMLAFAGRFYNISELNHSLNSSIPHEVDPYLHVSNDMQLHIKPQIDVREYGSLSDQQSASSTLSELRKAACESDQNLQDIIVQGLANILDLDMDDTAKLLSEEFVPDDRFMLCHQSVLKLDHVQSMVLCRESHFCDLDFQRSASTDDDTASESSVTEGSQCINKLPGSLPLTHIISVGQLLESALQVAGQVAGTSVSTSPLPYSMMASQCEAHGSCTRKKLSSWLGSSHELVDDKLSVTSLCRPRSIHRFGSYTSISKANHGGL